MRPGVWLLAATVLALPTGGGRAAEGDPGGGWSIRLERFVCAAGCPSYRLTIDAEGGVAYEGRQNVEWEGIARARADAGAVAALRARIDRMDFAALEDHYGMGGGQGCERYDSRAPIATLELVEDGRAKTVRHHTGCRGTGTIAALRALEQQIDSAARSWQWTGPRYPAQSTLARFEDAYGACNPDRLARVVALDPPTREFFATQCERCGGFDVDVTLRDAELAGEAIAVRFHQRVICRRSRTVTSYELRARVEPAEEGWQLSGIDRSE